MLIILKCPECETELDFHIGRGEIQDNPKSNKYIKGLEAERWNDCACPFPNYQPVAEQALDQFLDMRGI